MDDIPDDLERLAAAAGVIPRYVNDRGQPMASSAAEVAATLELLGLDLAAGPDAALRALRAERAAQPLTSVVVAWDGVLPEVPVRAPAGRPGTMWLETEDGDQLDPPTAWGSPLPLGQHRLVVEGSDWRAEASVFAAPTVAHGGGPKRWGVFLPLHALHTARTRGIGDLADLGRMFDWAQERGASAVVTLPLLAAWLDAPAQTSPYTPVSRRAWNELYADLDDLGVTDAEPAPEPIDAMLDHDALWAWKRPLLARAAEAAFAAVHEPEGLPAHLAAWLAEHPTAAAYARFRGAAARHGRNWRQWPERLRGGDLRPGDWDVDEFRFHVFAQWVTDTQLGHLADRVEARGQLLALDLAVGSHPDGFDVWEQQSKFVLGASVGAPPDFLFSGGQNWGFPPLHPWRTRDDGHRYLRDCLRHHLAHARLLRLDHVMGLHRLFWAMPGGGGCYVRYPTDELFALTSLEAWRRGAVLVGENLGTVPTEVYEALDRHRILGIWIQQAFWWGLMEGGFQRAPQTSVASSSTHDMPSFAGFWSGADIADRRDLGLIDDGDVVDEHHRRADLRRVVLAHLGADPDADAGAAFVASVGELADGQAQLAVVDIEDLWLEPEPQNVPGTSHERPNWRRVASQPLEAWDAAPLTAAVVERLRNRAPQPPADEGA